MLSTHCYIGGDPSFYLLLTLFNMCPKLSREPIAGDGNAPVSVRVRAQGDWTSVDKLRLGFYVVMSAVAPLTGHQRTNVPNLALCYVVTTCDHRENLRWILPGFFILLSTNRLCALFTERFMRGDRLPALCFRSLGPVIGRPFPAPFLAAVLSVSLVFTPVFAFSSSSSFARRIRRQGGGRVLFALGGAIARFRRGIGRRCRAMLGLL